MSRPGAGRKSTILNTEALIRHNTTKPRARAHVCVCCVFVCMIYERSNYYPQLLSTRLKTSRRMSQPGELERTGSLTIILVYKTMTSSDEHKNYNKSTRRPHYTIYERDPAVLHKRQELTTNKIIYCVSMVYMQKSKRAQRQAKHAACARHNLPRWSSTLHRNCHHDIIYTIARIPKPTQVSTHAKALIGRRMPFKSKHGWGTTFCVRLIYQNASSFHHHHNNTTSTSTSARRISRRILYEVSYCLCNCQCHSAVADQELADDSPYTDGCKKSRAEGTQHTSNTSASSLK